MRGLSLAVAGLAVVLASRQGTAESFPFRLPGHSKTIVDIDMSSPGSDWSKEGKEAALVNLRIDSRSEQQIMLYAGEARHRYSAFLGVLSGGDHTLTVERNQKFSAPGAGLKVHGVHFRIVPERHPDRLLLAHAPILFARAGSVGGFTDIPLLVYGERFSEKGQAILQYSVVFSNEDGGTATRKLMARWGRTADIEYVYRVWLNARGGPARAAIQGRDHKDVPYDGPREGYHPFLIPMTDNNMVSADGKSPIRYQIPPIPVDLAGHSRERVMDDHPFTYRVMARELERELKLRPYGGVLGDRIADPRNYLYLEAKITNQDSALAASVRLTGQTAWHSSHLGLPDLAIDRNGWVRTAIELPPGTKPGDLAEVSFQCLLAPVKPEPKSGLCRIETVSKAFFLDQAYRPSQPFWKLDGTISIPAGEMRTFPVNSHNQ